MTVQVSRLVPGSVLTNAAAIYYTCPAATSALIKRADFTNTSGSAVTVTVYMVPFGGSPAASNTVMSAVAIAPGVTYVSPELSGQVLGPQETLQAVCSANNSVTIMVSGLTIVGS